MLLHFYSQQNTNTHSLPSEDGRVTLLIAGTVMYHSDVTVSFVTYQ